MKRLKISRLGISIIVVALLVFIFLAIYSKQKNPKAISYVMNGKKYSLLVADDDEEWKQGLMNYRRLNQVDGMIFIFPDEKKRTFWNKNTYLNLQVYWIKDDKVVGRDPLPSIEKSRGIVLISSPVPVDKVVELVER